MIFIGRIDEIDPTTLDLSYSITKTMNYKVDPDKYQQLIELAPSYSLFQKYLGLSKRKKWNEKTFNQIYVTQFLKELNEKSKIKILNKIWRLDRDNYKIGLFCYCDNEKLCHRSIIAGLLQGVNANVVLNSKQDYSYYYEKFKELQ